MNTTRRGFVTKLLGAIGLSALIGKMSPAVSAHPKLPLSRVQRTTEGTNQRTDTAPYRNPFEWDSSKATEMDRASIASGRHDKSPPSRRIHARMSPGRGAKTFKNDHPETWAGDPG